MAYTYGVKKCNRCEEHFKEENSRSFDFDFSPQRPRSWEPDSYPASEITGGDYCPACKGYRNRMIIRAKELAKGNFERRRYKDRSEECPKCGGRGIIGGFTCPRCEGKGRLPIALFDRRFREDSISNFEAYKEYLPADFNKK